MAETLARLEAKRQGLIQTLAALGDFRRHCTELVEVNEQICQPRPVREVADTRELAQLKNKWQRRFAKKWRAKSSA